MAKHSMHGPAGGSVLGLIFGVGGSLLMIFAALLAVRKRLPTWRVGSAQFWLRGHLWLGTIGFVLILFHAGFKWGGLLENLLWISFGLLAPASPGDALAFLLSVAMAFHIFFALNFLTGLLAVFTEKLQGFLWAKFILLQFLSGQLLPLEFFKPYPTVHAILEALPFKGLAHTPLSIYLGRWDQEKIHSELLLQFAWTVALLIMCECGWRAVRRRLCALGG